MILSERAQNAGLRARRTVARGRRAEARPSVRVVVAYLDAAEVSLVEAAEILGQIEQEEAERELAERLADDEAHRAELDVMAR